MSATKPTVVIVHGAWQLAAAYANFSKQLSDSGFPTEVVPLPSVGSTESPLPGLTEDVAAVRKILTPIVDAGRDVLLFCHSYGGVVGSSAVEGFDSASRKREGKTGGVILTVYVAAFMTPKGKSLVELLGGAPPSWMSIEGDKCFAVTSQVPQILLNDLPADQAAQIASGPNFSHSSAVAFATPSTYEPWANKLPCAYVFCTEDNALPYAVQQQLVSLLGPDPVTFTLKAGHCPFLSVPAQLVEVISKAAEVGLSKKISL